MTTRGDAAAWQHLSTFRFHQRRAVLPINVIRDALLMRAAADDAITEVVRDMRADGASWSEIGDALGVTRQAAQQRYRTVTK